MRGIFQSRCNMEMIDFDELVQEDVLKIKEMIQQHHEYTHSRLALELLNDWDNVIRNFVKVMPKEYKRVLKEKEAGKEVNNTN